ncbi:hypothetical protein [Algoriphagus resistens]|uniref:hypothetical protein n=1 Tax=Algoriphagus resistens TaxID=1750590 RepID=UPI0007168D61|nr:hypothetical protein [Algoriphagus resistens]
MEIQWSSYLKVHFPALSEIYLDTHAEKEINEQLVTRNSELLKVCPDKYTTTFYDLFVRIINTEIENDREQEISRSLLGQLNDNVERLNNILIQNKLSISQVKNYLDGLFRVNGEKYLDKVGELLSTNYILENNNNFKLLQLEYKHEPHLGNKSKDSDLLIFDEVLKGGILVDILNVNLDHEKIEDEIGLTKILSHRIGNKYIDKRYHKIQINDSFKIGVIQPFIWVYDLCSILKYEEVFRNFTIYNSLPILLLRQKSNGQGQVYYDCIQAKDINS